LNIGATSMIKQIKNRSAVLDTKAMQWFHKKTFNAVNLFI